MKNEICLAYADAEGNVYDFPGIEPALRSGRRFMPVDGDELIELPYGSLLYMLPGRYPVFHNRRNNDYNYMTVSPDGGDISAVSSFPASGYLRTYLPAFMKDDDAPALPMWAYSGVVIIDGKFYVPALRIDDDPRSDPELHENDSERDEAASIVKRMYPQNRLVKQLDKCSKEYRCLCARNFFLGRYEAPVPTSPACNARCLGCLSFQADDSSFPASQNRLSFKPSAVEISEVILHHFKRVDSAVASFGQGCEGEPLQRADDLARAIKEVRKKTGRGTININTNGSDPLAVKKLCDAGLDSIRVSFNSFTGEFYSKYHRPVNYSFNDVKRSVETAMNAGIFVSVNLFFLPGFTDSLSEVESLKKFLNEFPVNMIQARNLNIDPDFYLDSIGFGDPEPMGIRKLLELLGIDYPEMRLGYYNPPKEDF